MTEAARKPRQLRDRSVLLLIIVATFGIQALTMVTGVISARMLGAEGRGEVALVFALGLLASQLTFGGSLPNAIAKNLAERQLAARDGLRSVTRKHWWWLLAPSLIAALLMLVLQVRDDAVDVGLVVAVFVMALQTMTFRILVGSLQGEIEHLLRMAAVGVIPQTLFTIVLVVAFASGWEWSALEVLIAFFVSSFISLVIGLFALGRPTGRVEDELDEEELWRETRNTYVSAVRPLDSIGLDRILVGGLLGTVVLGLYAAATAVSNLCSFVSNGVVVIVLPRVAMNHADPVAQHKVVVRWVRVSAVLLLLTVAGLQLIVDPAIRLAFGREFVGAIEVARWLIVADGLMAMRKVFIAVLQGQGRGGKASLIELALTPLMVGGIAFAALHDSIVLIGVSLTIVGALACVVLAIAVFRSTPFDAPATAAVSAD